MLLSSSAERAHHASVRKGETVARHWQHGAHEGFPSLPNQFIVFRDTVLELWYAEWIDGLPPYISDLCCTKQEKVTVAVGCSKILTRAF